MIHLDYRDSRPIYEQIRDQLRHLMVTGVLQSGDKLPSVRSLAQQLAINPNTIQRAYTELEQEGFIMSVTGRGSFVAESGVQNETRKKELLEKAAPILHELHHLGVSDEEILALLHKDQERS